MASIETDESAMILADIPTYTTDHTYVVKLHRDARPRDGFLKGRVEQLRRGDRAFFASAEELVAAMTRLAIAVDDDLFPEQPQGPQS